MKGQTIEEIKNKRTTIIKKTKKTKELPAVADALAYFQRIDSMQLCSGFYGAPSSPSVSFVCPLASMYKNNTRVVFGMRCLG